MQVRDPAWPRRLRAGGMVALIFGLVLACYWPALKGDFLWDDPGHVTRPDLRSWAGLARIWTQVRATQQYYPVLHTAFWVEHRLWGDAPLGYHLLNVLLHATSCCLLALLVRRLLRPDGAQPDCAPTANGRRDPGGGAVLPHPPISGAEWLAAAVFAVHPICVESVAWISEQKNTLSLVFYLLAALAYLDFAADRRPRAYGWASLWFLLALGTKSVTATLPAALVVVLWWRNGKLSWRRDVAPLLPWFVVALASGLFTAWVERRVIGAEGVQFELSAAQRVLLAGRVIWFYLGKLVWPAHQAFFYPRWDVAAEAPGWAGHLAAAMAVTAALWIIRSRNRAGRRAVATAGLAGWLLFVGSLFPALGFFNVYPFVFSFVADHFQYLASLWAIAAATVAVATPLAASPPWMRIASRLLGGLLVGALALLANRQSRLYVNDETLFRATLAQSPQSWMAHHILGFRLAMTPGHEAEAIAEYRTALRINPDYPDAHIGLALELARQPGHEAEAIRHLERALQLKPNAADAHNDLGLLLAAQPGRLPAAMAHYEAALRLNPNLAEAHANLANALATLPDRWPEALGQYEAALRLKPSSPEMHANYANLLARIPGRLPDAMAQYEAALRLNPEDAAAHANLGAILEQLPGRASEARAHYEAALRGDPGIAWVHLALALQLSSLPGREPDAIAHAEAALRLKPDYPEAHNCLAIVYAQQGRLQAARSEWEQALRLKPDYETARENLRRLDRMIRPTGRNP